MEIDPGATRLDSKRSNQQKIISIQNIFQGFFSTTRRLNHLLKRIKRMDKFIFVIWIPKNIHPRQDILGWSSEGTLFVLIVFRLTLRLIFIPTNFRMSYDTEGFSECLHFVCVVEIKDNAFVLFLFEEAFTLASLLLHIRGRMFLITGLPYLSLWEHSEILIIERLVKSGF